MPSVSLASRFLPTWLPVVIRRAAAACASPRAVVRSAAVRLHVVIGLFGAISCTDAAVPPTGVVQPSPAPVTPDVANVVPASQFAVSPRWPAPGDTVTFDGQYSHDSDGQVVRYRWVISNGVTQSTGAVARTVFRTAGTYTVSLTAVDDRGDSTTTTLSLPVSASGVPTGAVDATQSDLTLSAGSVTGGASVTATVTARTSAGALLSGVPVAVSSTGRRVGMTPLTGVTNGSGVWTTSVSSPLAQGVIVRAVADFTALVDTVPLTVTPAPAASASAVRLTQSTLTSLTDSALVEVTVRDTAGNPVSGASVTLSGAPAGLVVSNEGTTDANGRRVVTVKSTACGTSHTLTVVAGGVTLSTHPTLLQNALSVYGLCGATLWLDASDASTITTESGLRVTQWRDKSGSLNHASAASGSTARPTYDATVFNGRPGFVFTGGSSATSTPEHLSLAAYPGAGQAAMTYLAVYRRVATNSCDRLFDFGTGTNAYAAFSPRCSDQRFVVTTNGFANEVMVSGGTVPLGTTIVSTILHASTSAVRSNAKVVGTVVTTPTPSAIGAATNNWIGRHQSAAQGYFTGHVSELIAFPRTLTLAEYAAAERALMLKWGIGTMSIDAGDAQSAVAGTSPAIAPRIRIVDRDDMGIQGATVVWQVTAGGGRVSGGTTLTTTTDASGYTSVPSGAWVLDYGTNTLTAWYNTTAGSGQSLVFTGTGTLPSGLAVRYDANNASTLYRASTCTGTLAAPGDSVGCWMNTVNGTKHVTQSTAAARPTVASTFGTSGRPAVQFVLTRENYLETTATGIDSLAHRARTIVTAALAHSTEDNNTNAGGAIVIFPGWHSGMNFYGYPAPNELATQQWMQAASGTLLWSSNSYTTSAPMIGTQVLSTSGGATNNTAYVNGVSLFSANASGTPTPFYPNLMRVGQANVSPTTDYRMRLDGRIAEILIFNRNLGTTERQQAERYLGWKWGVTVP